MAMRDFRKRFDVADVAGRVADSFGKNSFGIFIDQLLDGVRLVAVGKTSGDALARQDVSEQGVRGSVELRDGDDVSTGVGEVNQCEMQRRLYGSDRERADAAFQFGDALFKHRR